MHRRLSRASAKPSAGTPRTVSVVYSPTSLSHVHVRGVRWAQARDQGRLHSPLPEDAPQAHVFVVLLRALAQRTPREPTPPGSILDRFARRARRHVLVDPTYPFPPVPGEGAAWRRARRPVWIFPDSSQLVRLSRPADFEPLHADGLGQRAMLDTVAALRAALARDRHDLLRGYVRVHGRLPRLKRDLLVRALESPMEEVRLCAMTSLRRSRSARRPGASGDGSAPGGSVAGAGPGSIRGARAPERRHSP